MCLYILHTSFSIFTCNMTVHLQVKATPPIPRLFSPPWKTAHPQARLRPRGRKRDTQLPRLLLDHVVSAWWCTSKVTQMEHPEICRRPSQKEDVGSWNGWAIGFDFRPTKTDKTWHLHLDQMLNWLFIDVVAAQSTRSPLSVSLAPYNLAKRSAAFKGCRPSTWPMNGGWME
jgi:hypothetical protein